MYYTTVSPQLKDDIVEVLYSLGFTATVTTKDPFYKDEDGNRVYCQLAYTIYVRGPRQSDLFSLSKKKDRCKYKPVRNSIMSIEPVGRDLGTCIAISGEEKLYITTNYIVTHNTYTALLTALKFMQEPGATGVIFRRTSKMLTAPGSIWHEAVSMYSEVYKTGLRIRTRETEIIFPNGSLLKFSHMQHSSNMYDHKGGQYSYVCFDEATDFTEEMIIYLLSRMRNTKVSYVPQMFLLTNPEYHSFLREWIQDFYLDPQTGIPMQEKSGVKRYYYRQGNKMLWYDDLEVAEKVHGSGDDNGIGSFTFIPFTCIDNPPLLKAQPSYVSNLKALPRVEMEKLLLGSWFARVEASQMWKREWVNEVDHPNGRARRRIRAWDIAGVKPSEANQNPDWTRGVLVSKDKSSVYTVEDVVGIRDNFHQVENLIFQTAIKDGKDVTISIPMDPNAQAAAYAKGLQRRLSEMGFSVRLQRPVKSKITRFAPFSSVTEAGFVNVVHADWNKDYYEELENFDGSNKKKDDQVDATADAFYLLNQEARVPEFELPVISSSSESTFGLQDTSFSTGLSAKL